MNIEDYISTGIVEAYVLGTASPAQREEFENHLNNYPELRRELELVEGTVEEFAQRASISPSPDLKARILGQIDEENVNAISPTRQPRWAFAASIAFAFIMSSLTLYYYSQWKTTSSSLADLVAQSGRIANDYNAVNQKLDKIQNDFEIIESVAFTRVVMKGTENAPEAMASVYWNQRSQEVYLSIQNLKELNQTNQFQLWAIVDGKPVDVGVFDKIDSGLIAMKSVAGATAFAITIERRGGVSSPTLEAMQVLGTTPRS